VWNKIALWMSEVRKWAIFSMGQEPRQFGQVPC